MSSATVVALLLSALLSGCRGDDDPARGEHAEVDDAAIYLAGVRVTGALVLVKGSQMRLEVRFLDPHGEPVEDLRPEHRASLSFEPPFLASVSDVSNDVGFYFDLSVATSGGASGVLYIGYTHAGASHETRFGPIEVVIGG